MVILEKVAVLYLYRDYDQFPRKNRSPSLQIGVLDCKSGVRLKMKICLFGVTDRLMCFGTFFYFTRYVWHFDSLHFQTFRSILIRCASIRNQLGAC